MNRRLLVIEDNAQNLYMMRFLLEKSGFAVISAKDGKQGVARALTCDPLAILLDIQLPGMDGYAVASELKRHPQLTAIPIIAVTSHALVGDREQILAAGATGYIEKPIDPATFVTEITSYFPAGWDGKEEDAYSQCRR